MQPPHHRIVPPVGMVPQMRHHRSALGYLPDAFERLVFAQAAQRPETVALSFVIEQIAAEDRDQLELGDERRQGQKHEPAFRAIAAPLPAALRRRLPKRSIAAAETAEILRVPTETPGDL